MTKNKYECEGCGPENGPCVCIIPDSIVPTDCLIGCDTVDADWKRISKEEFFE